MLANGHRKSAPPMIKVKIKLKKEQMNHQTELNTDAGLFASSTMSSALENTLNIVPPRSLPRRCNSFTNTLVGDETFLLKPHIMKPCRKRPNRGAAHF